MQIRQLLAAARAHPEPAAADAALLMAHVLNKPLTWLYGHPDAALTEAQVQRFRQLLARRAAGEPLAYLTGEKEFWSLTLKVTPATLVPRPETELLVETALALGAPDEALELLDLGTGSGAIALAIAHERPGWQVTATDLSPEALAVARENAHNLGLQNVRFLHGAWYQPLPKSVRFHLIVSNPPYVVEGDPRLQEDGLRHEPSTALAAGPEGLDDLRIIIQGAPAHLEPGGWLAVEHGVDQGSAVRVLFQKAGFEKVKTRRDLAGRDRVTLGCYACREAAPTVAPDSP